MLLEDRIAALELRVGRLERPGAPREDLHTTPERPTSVAPPAPRTAPVIASPRPAPVIAPPRPAPQPKPAREPIALEDFLGGRVLAWIGGVAVIAGLAFLLTVAISRGWIGESGRTALAAAVSTALLIAGARAREKRVRNDAALAAAAAGVAGLFGTLVVAGQVYDLIPLALALSLSMAVGAAATALAVRWRAQVMGWLGLIGALLAPAVLGDHGSIAFLAVAYGATVAVLVRERWTALLFTSFAIVTPQWVFSLTSPEPSPPLTVLTLVVFGALTAAAAVGFEIRRRETTVRVPAVILLVLNAIVLDAVGALTLHPAGPWLAAVAAAHLVVGLVRIPRVSRELSLVALGLGVILADIAFAALTSGLPLTLGWAASAVGFGWLLRRAKTDTDRALAMAGLGGHLASALMHALVVDVPGQSLGGGDAGLAAVVAIAAIGVSAAVSGRLAVRFRIPLDALALAALAYASALTLDGVALTVALAGQAAGLAALARRDPDPVATYGAAAFVLLAVTHVLGVVAPLDALQTGLAQPSDAIAALVAVAAAAALASRAPFGESAIAVSLRAISVIALAYLAAQTLDGIALTAAFSLEAAVLAALSVRLRDEPAAIGAALMAGLALTYALATLAPPEALIDGLEAPAAALAGLLAVLAALVASSRARFSDPNVRVALDALVATVALYLASIEVVTYAGAAGQTALSVLWAAAGVGALAAGLVTDRARLRQGALALLALTAGKVFVYDLASLDSMARVGSLVGMGLLLLAGGFFWQRVRPRTMPDLREAGADAR
jgi:uncharacterized membrane protein